MCRPAPARPFAMRYLLGTQPAHLTAPARLGGSTASETSVPPAYYTQRRLGSRAAALQSGKTFSYGKPTPKTLPEKLGLSRPLRSFTAPLAVCT
jgi:hypothetical protein